MSIGDRVQHRACATCDIGIVRAVDAGQVLVDFPDRTTWVDLADLEVA